MWDVEEPELEGKAEDTDLVILDPKNSEDKIVLNM